MMYEQGDLVELKGILCEDATKPNISNGTRRLAIYNSYDGTIRRIHDSVLQSDG